jgi:hypothetical protein
MQDEGKRQTNKSVIQLLRKNQFPSAPDKAPDTWARAAIAWRCLFKSC